MVTCILKHCLQYFNFEMFKPYLSHYLTHLTINSFYLRTMARVFINSLFTKLVCCEILRIVYPKNRLLYLVVLNKTSRNVGSSMIFDILFIRLFHLFNSTVTCMHCVNEMCVWRTLF